jgi:type IV pilus assembly protein PilC
MAAAEGARRRSSRPVARESWLGRNLPSLYSVKRLELIVFSRQMATFIRAGVPIIDGIRVVREQTTSRLFRRTLDTIANDLLDGEPISAALARHPRVFPQLYVDMVVAAEMSGELDAILNQLAMYLERTEATARRLRQATLYPSIVLGLAVIVVFILTTFVLPSFVALFADFEAELPLPTQILLALGDYGGRYGTLTAGALALVGLGLYLIRGLGPIRRLRDRVTLRLPVIGGLVRLGIATRFARTLGILVHAGVPISDAFDVAVSGTGNSVFRGRLGPVRERLLAGEGMAKPMAKAGLFGPLLLQMVKVGEETGTLDTYLEQAAEFMDSELDYKTRQMVTIIEPALILGVALMVGFVALSVVTPMYGILRQIK